MLYYMKTFGCQMNVSDSDMMATLLKERGFTETEEVREADLIVVNTCSVREKAELKAEGKIREFGAIKKKEALLWVVGCMAERVGEELKKRIKQVNRVIGAPQMEFLEDRIDGFLAPLGEFKAGMVPAESNWSAFLPVMRGCDKFCTYCIVPHVRGREHSIEADKIVEQAQKLVATGAREITLLGQNVNSYKDGETDFADLLTMVHEVEGLERLRFTTSHPRDISEKLIQTIVDYPKLCNHIHLPVQSGNSEVLKRMNRGYSREEYLEKIKLIKKLAPTLDLTTDVMVGFPGETEEQFEETLTLFEEIRYTNAFMFAFSSREGTRAAKYEDQIDKEIKTTRLNKLIALQTAITKEAYADMVGQEVEVYPTLKQENGRGWIGQDYGFKRVVIETDDDIGGQLIKAKVVRSSGMTLIAEVQK